MSLSDTQIVELCAKFRQRAQRMKEEARQSADIQQVVLLAALVATLRSVTEELEKYTDGMTGHPPAPPTGEPETSKAPSEPPLGGDEESR